MTDSDLFSQKGADYRRKVDEMLADEAIELGDEPQPITHVVHQYFPGGIVYETHAVCESQAIIWAKGQANYPHNARYAIVRRVLPDYSLDEAPVYFAQRTEG